MQNRRNYYRILHVERDAPPELLRASHRTLMLRLRMHPDLGGDHWNAALLNEAFETLIDPVKRAQYDASLNRPFDRGRGFSVPSRRKRPPVAPSPERSAAMPSCAFCGAVQSWDDVRRNEAMCAICDSPVCAVVKLEPGGSTRRNLERIACDLPIVFYLARDHRQPIVGRICDVSVVGMQFASDRKLTPGDRLRVDSAFCSAVCVVTRCRRAPDARRNEWRTGVEFLTLRIRRKRGLFVSAKA